MKPEVKKLILSNLPYLIFVYLFGKLGQAYRLAAGVDLSEKLLHFMDGCSAAFANAAPSIHPFDLLIGVAGAAALRLMVYEKGDREQPAGLYFDGRPDPKLGAFLRYEAKPNEPEHLREVLRQEQKGRAQLPPGDFKAHVTALHDGMILAEAQRIVAGMKDLSAPNSPNKTHFMVELSPYFVQIASSKDTDRLFSMLPYKSLVFTGIKDRHGIYAMIGKDENRDKEVRRPRASIRRQLSETKQAQAPKKAPARTKKNELEV